MIKVEQIHPEITDWTLYEKVSKIMIGNDKWQHFKWDIFIFKSNKVPWQVPRSFRCNCAKNQGQWIWIRGVDGISVKLHHFSRFFPNSFDSTKFRSYHSNKVSTDRSFNEKWKIRSLVLLKIKRTVMNHPLKKSEKNRFFWKRTGSFGQENSVFFNFDTPQYIKQTMVQHHFTKTYKIDFGHTSHKKGSFACFFK